MRLAQWTFLIVSVFSILGCRNLVSKSMTMDGRLDVMPGRFIFLKTTQRSIVQLKSGSGKVNFEANHLYPLQRIRLHAQGKTFEFAFPLKAIQRTKTGYFGEATTNAEGRVGLRFEIRLDQPSQEIHVTAHVLESKSNQILATFEGDSRH